MTQYASSGVRAYTDAIRKTEEEILIRLMCFTASSVLAVAYTTGGRGETFLYALVITAFVASFYSLHKGFERKRREQLQLIEALDKICTDEETLVEKLFTNNSSSAFEDVIAARTIRVARHRFPKHLS